ncbi:MAG: urease accessory protein UreD [Burkholderiaceae bacterium]
MKLNDIATFSQTPPSTNAVAIHAPVTPAWHARLTLGFADDAGTTRLVERSFFGPLRVQKPLYPEGPQVCHAIVVHPPGGVVGGDQLAISAKIGAAAHAFITTPGATKWYKANGRVSRQDICLDVSAGAKLEWLPQETLFFDAAHVALTQSVSLAKDASYIACDILCFGRTASGESFNSGKIAQRTSIRRDGRLIWWEQGVLAGGSAAMRSSSGLRGNTVCATLIAAGKPLPAVLLNLIRQEVYALCGNDSDFGISQLKSVLVARYLGNSSEIARHVMLRVWHHLRPEIMSCAAVVPRIWNT